MTPCAIATATAGVTEIAITIAVSEVGNMRTRDEITDGRSLTVRVERQTPVDRATTMTVDTGDQTAGGMIGGVMEIGGALSIAVRTHNLTGRNLFVLPATPEDILIDRLQQPFSTLASTATG